MKINRGQLHPAARGGAGVGAAAVEGGIVILYITIRLYVIF